MTVEPIKLTVDTVALAAQEGQLEIVLIRRKHDHIRQAVQDGLAFVR